MKRLILVLSMLLITSTAFAGSKLKLHKMNGVANEYLVVLADQTPSDSVQKTVKALAKQYGVQVLAVWSNALNGFHCKATDESINRLVEEPAVEFIEQNFLTDTPKLSATQWALHNGEYLWHLDRIDEPTWAGAGGASLHDGQHNMCTEGRGAVAYVIDTGVQADHPQFETPSRVVLSLDFSADRTDQSVPFTEDVTNGCTAGQDIVPHRWHGTAVASVLGGTQVGVAKPMIVSLKIADCFWLQAPASNLINAVNWIGSQPDQSLGTTGDPYRAIPA